MLHVNEVMKYMPDECDIIKIQDLKSTRLYHEI